MKTKIMLIFLMVLNCLILPAVHADDKTTESVKNQGASHRRGERMWKKIQGIYNQLDLTEAQKKQLGENKSKSRTQMKNMFEKKRALRQAMRQELMKPELDMNKISDIQTQLKTSHSEMVDQRLESILEVRKILNPEQFQKFLALLEKLKKGKSSREK